jgi:hypothetical protein
MNMIVSKNILRGLCSIGFHYEGGTPVEVPVAWLHKLRLTNVDQPTRTEGRFTFGAFHVDQSTLRQAIEAAENKSVLILD